MNMAADLSGRMHKIQKATWLNVIERTFQRCRRAMTLDEIYGMVSAAAGDKIKQNPHWKAKIRQIVGQNQKRFRRVDAGKYELIAA